ncbi:6-carboxytetrahydropterin synthase [Eubacterium xylanophilum]|uniref:6-carboxytetrahydropterin synthase n=1 Tax=Eubacterium xylanophilum TaxID=39497 RepID=UPI0004AC90BA|nr:6-carboxytetrahydropterin synthase [Eubacterium xylanophilum]MCR5797982.1 6-carboxytetrahydropterin synthase [Eubacterium sp.]
MNKYRQYKFKFYLNARHAIYIKGKLGEIHPHTWEIALYMIKARDGFVRFDRLEKKIEEVIEPYQDKFINEIEPFDVTNPTLENCCHYFKGKISEILTEEGWILLSMEMSETPARSYVLSITDESESERERSIEMLVDSILEDIKSE